MRVLKCKGTVVNFLIGWKSFETLQRCKQETAPRPLPLMRPLIWRVSTKLTPLTFYIMVFSQHRWRLGFKTDEWNKRGSDQKTQNGEPNSRSLTAWRIRCITVTMVTNPTTSTARQLTLTRLLYWDPNFRQSTHAHQARPGVICRFVHRRRHIGEGTRDHIEHNQWPLVTLVPFRINESRMKTVTFHCSDHGVL